MRVPTLERRVEPTAGGVPTHVGAVPTADYGAVGRGAAAIGGAVDKAVDEQKKANAQYEEQKHQADIVAARNAATELESFDTSVMYGDSAGASTQGTKLAEAGDQGSSAADLGAAVAPAPTEPSPGFLSTKGMDAAANGENTFQALKKRRDELAGKLANDNQRQLFLQHSDQTLAETRRRIEGHTAQQVDVAKEDSINAAADEAVRAAAVEPGDDELARNRIAGVVGPIHALNRGQEWADSETLKVQQRVAATRIDALIAKKDVAGAERVLDANKWALGGQLDDYTKAVALAREKQTDNALALDLVNGSRKANGFIDTAKVIESLQAVPEEKRTPALEQAVSKWMTLESAKQNAVTDDVFNRALSAYLTRHQLSDVDPKDELWLRNPENSPQGWLKLEQISKVHHEAGPATGAQSRAMTEFLVDVADNPEKYATMPPGEFNRTWLPRFSRADGERAGSVLAQMHTKANKPENLSPVENKMLLQMGREAGVFDPKQNDVSKWNEDDAQNFYAAQQLLGERVAAEKRATGKSPDIEKVKGWVKELLLQGKDPNRFSVFGIGGGTTRLEAQVKGTDFEPKWDDDEKAAAAEALRKRNARVDDAAIDRLLRLKHGLPALPVQAAPAKAPDEMDPGKLGLDLTPPAPPSADREPTGPGKF